jgi:hypothetical protein
LSTPNQGQGQQNNPQQNNPLPGGFPNFPGLTPPAPAFDFNTQYQREFEEMQARCFRLLHRPDTVKIIGFRGALYYICRKCLDRYMKKHEELKEVVVAFRR